MNHKGKVVRLRTEMAGSSVKSGGCVGSCARYIPVVSYQFIDKETKCGGTSTC
jgi:hypothetical protein